MKPKGSSNLNLEVGRRVGRLQIVNNLILKGGLRTPELRFEEKIRIERIRPETISVPMFSYNGAFCHPTIHYLHANFKTSIDSSPSELATCSFCFSKLATEGFTT